MVHTVQPGTFYTRQSGLLLSFLVGYRTVPVCTSSPMYRPGWRGDAQNREDSELYQVNEQATF